MDAHVDKEQKKRRKPVSELEEDHLYLKKWLVDVKRGRYSIRSVANPEMRDKIESILIREYEKGELDDVGKNALINWKLIQIFNKVILIEDVDERIRPMIQEAIDNGVKPSLR